MAVQAAKLARVPHFRIKNIHHQESCGRHSVAASAHSGADASRPRVSLCSTTGASVHLSNDALLCCLVSVMLETVDATRKTVELVHTFDAFSHVRGTGTFRRVPL